MIRRVLPAIGLLALSISLAAIPCEAPACAPAPPEHGRVDISAESALIVWDEATKTEHFIRRAVFQSTSPDFGFLVPTPTKPELEQASDNLFRQLAIITAPKIIERTRYDVNIGCGGSAPTISAPAGGVAVLEEKDVGPFRAAVLAFNASPDDNPETGATALSEWLTTNGYFMTPALRDWLKPYVRQNWIITAFKIANTKDRAGKDRHQDQNQPDGYSLQSAAVRMSFKVEDGRPFYPYREPADQRDPDAAKVNRKLAVYVAARERMAGKLGDGSSQWPGRTVWANKVKDSEWSAISGNAELHGSVAASLPEKWWLTEFEDPSTPRPGTDEVYFEPSRDQSIVARLPTEVRVTRTPWLLDVLVFVGLPVGAIAVLLLLLRLLERLTRAS